MPDPLPFAEDVNYWKTGQSAPDTWTDKTIAQIQRLGGEVRRYAFGYDLAAGRQAFMLEFTIDGAAYKIVWPVLPTRGTDNRSARRQSATLLYHDVKARCISAAILGKRAVFFSFLVLPDGRTAAEVATPELEMALPEMFRKQLPAPTGYVDGNVVEIECTEDVIE